MPVTRKLQVPAAATEEPLRRRILDAAFFAFSKNGYAATSTLEIATGAKVSKRELYAAVGNKQELLVACIKDRALQLAAPADVPAVHDRGSLEIALTAFGEQQLGVLRGPKVIAMFRLAIAEAERAPEIAQALDGIAREASRARLGSILEEARAQSLLTGEPDDMKDAFRSLLFGDVMIDWLIGTKRPPSAHDIKVRAQRAAAAFMRLYGA